MKNLDATVITTAVLSMTKSFLSIYKTFQLTIIGSVANNQLVQYILYIFIV
jgi:hypothetical protein